MARVRTCDVERLAEDVRKKILAEKGIIVRSEGPIIMKAFQTDGGFNIKLTLEH